MTDTVSSPPPIPVVHMYLARTGSRPFEGRYWRVTHPWEPRGSGDMSYIHSHWRDVDVGNFVLKNTYKRPVIMIIIIIDHRT